MELETKIKSMFRGAVVEILPGNPETIEVLFPRAKGSVVITKVSKNQYSASYPELVKDNRDGYKSADGFSKDMLLEGVLWVLKQVKKHGRVKPKIMD